MVNNYSIQSVTVSRKQRAGFLAGTALGLSLVLPAVPGAISTASAQTTNLLSVPLGYCERMFLSSLSSPAAPLLGHPPRHTQ